MAVALWLLVIAAIGVGIGTLARVAVPVPGSPSTTAAAAVTGLVGAALGAAAGLALFNRSGGLVFSVAGATLAVFLVDRRREERGPTKRSNEERPS